MPRGFVCQVDCHTPALPARIGVGPLLSPPPHHALERHQVASGTGQRRHKRGVVGSEWREERLRLGQRSLYHGAVR